MAFGLYEGSELYVAPLRDIDTERKHGFEVLVSPVPVQLWKTICRLSIRIKDRPGALATATEFLRHQRINILLSECCSTYQRRAHWDAICDIAQTPGADVLDGCPREQYEHAMQNLLDVLTGKFSHFMEEPAARDAFLLGTEKHVQFSPLTGLNDTSFAFEPGYVARIEHRFGALELPERIAAHISKGCHFDNGRLPSYAMITGNTEQRYMRILFLKDYSHMFRLVIDDELRDFTGGGVGVLNQVLAKLPPSVNLFRASNYIFEKRDNLERGRIDLIGHWDEETASPVDRQLPELVEALEIVDAEKNVHRGALKVAKFDTPDTIYPRVFISYSIGHEEDKLQILKQRLFENNFHPVVGTDFEADDEVDDDDDVTGDVVKSAFRGIRGCVAFISLQVKRPEYHVSEGDSDTFLVSPWLIAEEVYAWSRKVGLIIRLKHAAIDEVSYNRNTRTKVFSDDASYEHAVELVIAELNAFTSTERFVQVEQEARRVRFRKRHLPRES
jgi:hypothetical protein